MSELIQRVRIQWQSDIGIDLLIDLWKHGNVYVSHVERTKQGYMPSSNCKWSTKRLDGYFGYNDHLGLYEISDTLINPLAFTLEATLSVGSPAYCITVAPNRENFVVGDRSGKVHIGIISRGSFVKAIETGHNRVWTLSYSPHGDRFASGHEDGTIALWDSNGEQISPPVTAQDWVYTLCFSPDGKYILSGHKQNDPERANVRLWTTDPLDHVGSFFHHPSSVTSVRYLPDGTGFISAGRDKSVACVLFDRNEPLFNQRKHKGTVTYLIMHPIGGIAISGAWTGTVKVWDLQAGDDLRTIEAHRARITSLAFSPSGRMLASGGKDSQIAIWQMPECMPLKRTEAHSGWVRGICFIDEDTLISVGSEGTCKIWRLTRRFPIVEKPVEYKSMQELLDDYRGPSDEDDE